MIWTFFTLKHTLIYATWLLSSISFSNEWTVGFFLWSPFNFVFVLDPPKTGITDSNFFVCLKQRLQRESRLWILQYYDRFRHINSANLTTICCCVYGCSVASWEWNYFIFLYILMSAIMVSVRIWLFCKTICLSVYVKNVNRMSWRPLLLDGWSSIGTNSLLSLRVWLNSSKQ